MSSSCNPSYLEWDIFTCFSSGGDEDVNQATRHFHEASSKIYQEIVVIKTASLDGNPPEIYILHHV